MVRIQESNNNKQDDAVTSKYFLSSIMSWYNEQGIHCGIESVSNLFENKNDQNKRGVAVRLSVLGEMPKCRARVIGEDGKAIRYLDDVSGEERDEIAIISDPQEVTFFFNVRIEDVEKNEISINTMSSCFPLFNYAFQQTGELPEGNNRSFICDIDELKDALEGLEFNATAESKKFKGGNAYYVLIPNPVVAE